MSASERRRCPLGPVFMAMWLAVLAAAHPAAGQDTTPPALASARIDALGTITLRFDEDLVADALQNTQFTLRVDSVPEALRLATGGEREPRVIRIDSYNGIRSGETVQVSYVPTVTALRDAAGNEVAAFTTGMNGVPAVVNGSAVSADAPAPPEDLVASAVGKYRIDLAWRSPLGFQAAVLTGYRIDESTDAGATWRTILADTGDPAVLDYRRDGLPGGSTRHFRVLAVSGSGTSAPSRAAVATARGNSPPTLVAELTFAVAENVPPDTAVGDPIMAEDEDDDDLLTFRLTGAGAQVFAVRTSETEPRAVDIVTAAPLDFEDRSSFPLTLVADDGDGGTTEVPVTIDVTNVDEPPLAPGTPALTALGTDPPGVRVSWSARNEPTRPPIVDYDVEYRQADAASWTNGPENVVETSTTIENLTAAVSYLVRVRATNADGDGPWSPTAGVNTETGPNRPPVFPRAAYTFTVPENVPEDPESPALGETIMATDPDGDSLTYSLEGPDAGTFHFDSDTGVLQRQGEAAFNYERKAAYSVLVVARDWASATAVNVTVEILNQPDPLPAPRVRYGRAVDGYVTRALAFWSRPTVPPDSSTRFTYDVQFRAGAAEWRNGPSNVPYVEAEIDGLEAGTVYDFRARARNHETVSPWSSELGQTYTHDLSARLAQAPRSHNGTDEVAVVVEFAEPVTVEDETTLGERFRLQEVGGGGAAQDGVTLTSAERLSPTRIKLTIDPGGSDGGISIRLPRWNEDRAGRLPACSSAGVYCTAEGRRPSHDLWFLLPGPTTSFASIRAPATAVDPGGEADLVIERETPSGELPPVRLELSLLQQGDVVASGFSAIVEMSAGQAASTLRLTMKDGPDYGGRVVNARFDTESRGNWAPKNPKGVVIAIRGEGIDPAPSPGGGGGTGGGGTGGGGGGTGGGGGGGGGGGDDGDPGPGDDGDGDGGDGGGDGDGDGGDGGGGGDDDGDGGGSGPPRAAITVDADCAGGLCRARTGVAVLFTDSSAGSVRSRRWDFGDEAVRSGASVRYAWNVPGFHDVTLSVGDGATESTASLTFLVEASEPAGTCQPDANTLCLRHSRYAVGVDWTADGGDGGRADVVRAGTDDSGLFRFFDPDNWEVLIKVLDGCERNGAVWVFAASTTNLGYRVHVTDTVTGDVREYRNDPGTPAAAITDVAAFRESCGAD